ncbi:MAG TPA: right-handed parallel beta-helix repeat-containing protein [Niabella sp.]|nr:right-handed parallel beta-helix repeat-containing protein [Niabella sp.]HQX21319.1 right-handed parallel beta-helix repeat-containing protein [Niabella sp.]HQX41902.1 right-handed parallel beta-helix repeat-containing protein [Niabella sp.]HRB08093.1 right-handed parallel beta-helix repeat-containing protein [Niabella sp.]HRB28518.1 right-handed parallel beta-helix repeat-containing protein [Niabella sp.]
MKSRLPQTLILFLILTVVLNSSCSKVDGMILDWTNTQDSIIIYSPKLPIDLRKPLLNVRLFGAKGNGTADDTKAFQTAIDLLAANGGGTVMVPAGVYAIDARVSVQLKSKVDLFMLDTTSVLKAIPNDATNYVVLMIADAMDVQVRGGKILGERTQHLGTKGEWGMGIGVYGSANVRISNMVIADCWGDGIYISDNKAKTHASAFVGLKNVISRNNRRQGLSIIKASYILVDSCKFIYTNGTAPQAGIDIEPNYDTASYITIRNTECAYNKGSGIQTYELKTANPTVITNLEIHNNHLHHNSAWGGRISGGRNINFTENRIYSNALSPMIFAKDTINCVLAPNQNE